MTNLELALNTLAEATTTEISKKENPSDFEGSLDIAKSGGKIAGNARIDIEKRLKENIVTEKNSKEIIKLNKSETKILNELNTKN